MPAPSRGTRAWRVALVAGLVGLCSVCGAERAHASRSAVRRPAVGGSASLMLGRLRGGAEDAGDDETLGRMRMQVAAGTTSDASLVEMSAADAAALGLESGSHVTLRGRKQRRTTSVVVVADKGQLGEGEVRLSATARSNVCLAEGEDVIVASEHDLPDAERVLLLPFASDLAAYDGTVETAFSDALAPFLKDNDRPLTMGDVVETTVGDATIRWKVRALAWKRPAS